MEPLDSSVVRKSLLTYMTTLGVDDWLFIVNVEVALIFTMSLKLVYWPAIAVLLHFALMLVTKLSPQILESYAKHRAQASAYWPGPSPLQSKNPRPMKFGRNESHMP